jgi:predicted methyltransferase
MNKTMILLGIAAILGACGAPEPPAAPAAPAATAAPAAPAAPAAAANMDEAAFWARFDTALAAEHRGDKHKARDQYRHPKETLQFFGLKPGLRVIEIWPGGGWYTELLAPALRDTGKLVLAVQDETDMAQPEFEREMVKDYKANLGQHPELYDQAEVVTFNPPKANALGPDGSADLVVTFRNVHNWVEAKGAADAFAAFYKVLKPGGTLGVEEHRAAPGKSAEESYESGYMSEDAVTKFATDAGFTPAGKSEVNANSKDTKDYPKGVWTLPPTLVEGKQDRDKYLAIGESDRMTLRFVKPAK